MKTKPAIMVAALLLSAAVALGGCTEVPANVSANPPLQASPAIITADTHHELKDFFARHGYDWKSLDHGVPPFILETLPNDLDRIRQVTEKKRIFFLSLLPMVLMVNDEIDRQREELSELFELHDAGLPLDSRQRALVAGLARQYGLKKDPLANDMARKSLFRRVDIIPPSLALAQAANESAWGTSRFARQGNNLFGEWTFIPGTGIVPKERPDGQTYEVRRFATLYDSVKSYTMNLNTHRAYRPLRGRRANLRAASLPLRGADLARGLKLYSSRGQAYVEEIRAIIRRNHLSFLSAATLRASLSTSPEET